MNESNMVKVEHERVEHGQVEHERVEHGQGRT